MTLTNCAIAAAAAVAAAASSSSNRIPPSDGVLLPVGVAGVWSSALGSGLSLFHIEDFSADDWPPPPCIWTRVHQEEFVTVVRETRERRNAYPLIS